MASTPDTTPSNIRRGKYSRLIRAPGRLTKKVMSWLTGAHRWRWIAATCLLFTTIGVLAVLVGIVFTPSRSVDALEQHFTLRAAAPSLTLSGHGEITVNTGRPQTFHLLSTQYHGPLRVHMTVDAPFQGSDLLNETARSHQLPPKSKDDFQHGFQVWLWWFVGVAMTMGLVLAVIAAFVSLLITGRRRYAILLIVRSFVMTFVEVGGVSTLFVLGSTPVGQAGSLDGLVGHSTLHLTPQPEGPILSGYQAVSIGDSRAATQGGKDIVNPSKEDVDCQRSNDALAAQIGRLQGWHVLNLACSSATINEGLMGGQSRGGHMLAPQMSRVKRMTNLQAVFVTIGPNDLWWSRAIGLCYVADVCNDNLTVPDYEALLEKLKWSYHDLLVELQNLTNSPDGTRPKIVINGSYDVFSAGDTCEATKGLTPDKIAMLRARNVDLNQALQTGAGLFGFTFIKPKLKTLCDDSDDAPGPDLRGPKDRDAFHPTGQGVSVMATDDVLALAGVGDGIALAPPK